MPARKSLSETMREMAAYWLNCFCFHHENGAFHLKTCQNPPEELRGLLKDCGADESEFMLACVRESLGLLAEHPDRKTAPKGLLVCPRREFERIADMLQRLAISKSGPRKK